MDTNTEALGAIIRELVEQILATLQEAKEQTLVEEAPTADIDLTTFFNEIRPMFVGTLQASQVSGMEATLKAFTGVQIPVSSEERRVGKACVSTCGVGWSTANSIESFNN